MGSASGDGLAGLRLVGLVVIDQFAIDSLMAFPPPFARAIAEKLRDSLTKSRLLRVAG